MVGAFLEFIGSRIIDRLLLSLFNRLNELFI